MGRFRGENLSRSFVDGADGGCVHRAMLRGETQCFAFGRGPARRAQRPLCEKRLNRHCLSQGKGV